MSAEAETAVTKHMAVTHEELRRGFSRLFPEVTSEWQVVGGDRYRFNWAGGEVEVRLAPESDRRLGMLRIPCTPTTLVFMNIAADDVRGFIERFDRRFQRGGG